MLEHLVAILKPIWVCGGKVGSQQALLTSSSKYVIGAHHLCIIRTHLNCNPSSRIAFAKPENSRILVRLEDPNRRLCPKSNFLLKI